MIVQTDLNDHPAGGSLKGEEAEQQVEGVAKVKPRRFGRRRI